MNSQATIVVGVDGSDKNGPDRLATLELAPGALTDRRRRAGHHTCP